MSKKNTQNKKTYEIDYEAYSSQMLKEEVSNWIISEGVTMITDGKTPGKNVILFLEHMKIIK